MAKTLTEAAASGDRRATLVALRDNLARSIDACESGRDMAALSKRLMGVIAEIDGLPEPRKASALQKAKRARGD